MTLFKYKSINEEGREVEGSIEAVNRDVAISSLQRRGLVISGITSADDVSLFKKDITLFSRVSVKDIVILSRQIATLFEAQVSALRIFRLLGAEVDNPLLAKALEEVSDDLQGGSSISHALEKHPKIFTSFYVNMVKAGEESGKLDQTFEYLADYMDRSYEITSKAKNALIYPAFVIFVFIAVMVLMLTTVIPRISSILVESGQEIPLYTQIVLAISNFFVNYGIFFAVALVIGGFFLWKYIKSESGNFAFSKFKVQIPFLGTLYKKLYLSRIADNMNTMLISGIPMVRALEVTASVVDNALYEQVLNETVSDVRAGGSVSASMGQHEEIPGIMVQMIKIGEETGELGNILKTLAKFYQREVNNTVDTLVGLIEPAMIVLLGVGVGVLLASVLIPIYNISAGI